MSAYEIPNLRFSAESGAVIARRRFMKINAAGQAVQTGAGENVIGASMVDNSKAGEVAELADGIVIVEAGAAVVAGTAAQSDANGKAITIAAGEKAGVFMTSAAAGELVSVKI